MNLKNRVSRLEAASADGFLVVLCEFIPSEDPNETLPSAIEITDFSDGQSVLQIVRLDGESEADLKTRAAGVAKERLRKRYVAALPREVLLL